MEGVGFAIGIPGLILLIAKAYIGVNRAVGDYRELDCKLSNVLTKISLEEKMFGIFVDRILCDLVDEDRRRLLKLGQNIQDEMLHKEIEAGLGDLSVPIEGYMRCTNDVLEKISAILGQLGPPPKAGNIGRASPIHTLALHTINLSLYGRASPSSPIHQLSARRKMKLFSKGTYGRLKELLEGLREQNSLLERCLGILDRKPTDHIVMPAQQQPSIASAIPTSPPKATETPTSTTVINPEFRPDKAEDPPEETVQQSSLSTMLYRALAKAPLCKCHLLYLRLESHSCSQLDPSRTIGFSMLVTSSNVSETRVSVNPSPKTSGDLFLEIMNDLTNDKGKSSQLCTGNLCDTLFGSSQDQVSYLLDNFLVKRVRNSQKYTTTGCTALSLHDLIEDKRGVTHYDRLILSAKLGKAAISLHSSPWTKGWSTRTIKFFAEYEESSQPASWKPHISTTFNSDYIVLPSNTDVYALGMMLLEIGDADTEHFEYPQMLKPALRTITMQMGRPYRKIVERCFNTYQDSVTMDNSDDSNINALRTEIEELESYVTSCFNF